MSFLPPNFVAPSAIETEWSVLRPITIHDVIRDYEAVMSSQEHLWRRFGKHWGWPPLDLSIEQDIIDLAWHQKEAQIQSSFNYAVMSPDENRLLGCVYVDPPDSKETEADVWFWARQSELASGFEEKLEEFVIGWLKNNWPFTLVCLNNKVLKI